MAVAFLIVAALACANMPESTRQRNSTVAPSNSGSATGASTAMSDVNWHYSETEDQMGRGKVYLASIESTNTISLDFPYKGEQHGTLTLREHPEHGKDVYLRIEKGQLLDSQYNDSVLVRFDNDKPIRFNSTGPSDHSTETLFLVVTRLLSFPAD
jgi:hypothetical protein